MSWFGWLTKGRCEVSALDIAIAGGEFIVAIIAVVIVLAAYHTAKDKLRKARK
jgi:hypothetical protein